MAAQTCPEDHDVSYFLNIPKNIRSFEVSSGGFSAACVTAFWEEESEVDDGAVDAGEVS